MSENTQNNQEANKIKLFEDAIEYIIRNNEDSIEFNKQGNSFYIKPFLDYEDHLAFTSSRLQDYSMSEMIVYALSMLHEKAKDGRIIDKEQIRKACQDSVIMKMSENDFEFHFNFLPSSTNLSSLLNNYFNNQLSEEDKKQFDSGDDFKQQFFDSTNIPEDISVELDEVANNVLKEKLIVQVSDITPVELNYDLGLGEYLISLNLAGILSGNLENFDVEFEDSQLKEMAQKRALLENIYDLCYGNDNDPETNAINTGIMRPLVESGLTAEILMDTNRYSNWLKDQPIQVKRFINNMIDELNDTSEYLSHITYFSEMSFVDALEYNVTRRIIKRHFPNIYELGVHYDAFEQNKKDIPDEKISPELNMLGIELNHATGTIISPVSGANCFCMLRDVNIKIPLDSVYIDEVNADVYPQIGEYNYADIYGEKISRERCGVVKECTIVPEHATQNLPKMFGLSEEFRNQLANEIVKLDNQIEKQLNAIEQKNKQETTRSQGMKP